MQNISDTIKEVPAEINSKSLVFFKKNFLINMTDTKTDPNKKQKTKYNT